jgi:hypothetical protein
VATGWIKRLKKLKLRKPDEKISVCIMRMNDLNVKIDNDVENQN